LYHFISATGYSISLLTSVYTRVETYREGKGILDITITFGVKRTYRCFNIPTINGNKSHLGGLILVTVIAITLPTSLILDFLVHAIMIFPRMLMRTDEYRICSILFNTRVTFKNGGKTHSATSMKKWNCRRKHQTREDFHTKHPKDEQNNIENQNNGITRTLRLIMIMLLLSITQGVVVSR
jgi:hypothetical protein